MEPIMQVLGRAVRRGGVFLVGMTLLIAGSAMLVLPGPGIAVILAGLVVLSAEFLWAKRVLAWVRQRFSDLRDQAQARWPGGDRTPPSGPPTRDRPDQAA
ncbi:MAG TPA: PGPGW domain-containing protein [Actinomycetota bacterium]|nr:PGPGW domain-containing protein [Actinomycetota bacterium]